MRHTIWVGLLLAACSSSETLIGEPESSNDAWLYSVEAPAPTWLSQTGIYADLAALTPSEVMVAYTPPYPLWSNGADKGRLLYMPPGETIDASVPGAWVFPIGTVISKTFSLENIEGRSGVVQLETRVMLLRAEGWEYAEYHWNREGTQARLLEGNWAQQDLALNGEQGTFGYAIPARLDCRACHETPLNQMIIGIDALNFDPELATAGLLMPAPQTRPLPARSAVEADAMAYFVGNCVHCHHGEGGVDNAAFSLRPADLIENTIGVETESSASGDGIRIVPGDVLGSAIYEAVLLASVEDYSGEFKPMPPAGIDIVDPQAKTVLQAWIESL